MRSYRGVAVQNKSEHRPYCTLRFARDQMSVTADHFFRLVARPRIDGSLINSRSRTVASKAVTEDMPASEFRSSANPAALRERR
jgi:hypothetical protein